MPANYVDRLRGVKSSQAIKVPCRVATTANITLSGLQTIDGVTLVENDRVLVKDQSTASENGIWEVRSTSWRRSPDWDGSGDVVKGTRVYVTGGDTQRGEWAVATSNPITIGTTGITLTGVILGDGEVHVESYGAVADGVTQCLDAINAALATGRPVAALGANYRVNGTIRLKIPGQKFRGAGKRRTRIFNDTTDDHLFWVGDPDTENGAAPFSGISDFTLEGNADTLGGLTLWAASLVSESWNDSSKDVSLDNIEINGVGDGWALTVFSWENNLNNVTLYENNKKGVRFLEEAQRNIATSLYITDCDEESLSFGGPSEHVGGNGICRANTIFGLVVQQSGPDGTNDACINFIDGEANAIYSLYSESNNSKGASVIVHIDPASRGTIIDGVIHLSGGSIVVQANGFAQAIRSITSSNITGSIVAVTDANASGMISNIEWLAGVTPTGVKVGGAQFTASAMVYLEGRAFFNDMKISSFTPTLEFEDRSANATDFRMRGDAGVLRVQVDSDSDGTYEKEAYRYEDATSEFVVTGDVRGYFRVLAASAVSVSHTGDTNETALATIVIPAGAMGANGMLRVTTVWSYTNSANNKTPRVRLGGISGSVFLTGAVTTTASLSHQCHIHNRNSASSQVGGASGPTAAWGTSTASPATGSIDTAVAQDLVISGQLDNSSETITLESYLVELLRRA